MCFFLVTSSYVSWIDGIGCADTTVQDVWQALTSSETNDKINMLREIRFPREIAAIGVGAALAVAGAIIQGLTRNPLADPGLLGLTAGANAALAIAVAIQPSLHYVGIMVACFIGAGIGSFLVFGIGTLGKGDSSPFRLVLARAAVSVFLHAVAEGIALVFQVSKDVSMWTAGGADRHDMESTPMGDAGDWFGYPWSDVLFPPTDYS